MESTYCHCARTRVTYENQRYQSNRIQQVDAGHAVIVGGVLADGRWSARPGRQFLVAHLHLAVVEGVNGPKTGGQGQLGGVVEASKVLWRGARVVGHLQRLVEALEAARRRVGGGEIEDVAEQDQFAVVVPSDVAAHLREAESLRLVVKHPRERAVAEMQIAYRVEGHRARSLTPLIRRDGEISPPASALVRRREVALAQRRLRGRACRPRG